MRGIMKAASLCTCSTNLGVHLSCCTAAAAAASICPAVSDQQPGPTVNLAAVVEHNPLLAVSVMEAALHVLPDYNGRAFAAVTNRDRMENAGATCLDAVVALPILAEVIAARVEAAGEHTTSPTAGTTARGQRAVAGASSIDSTQLEQKMFCMLVAALKYVQYSAGLTRAAGPMESAVAGCYFHSATLLCAVNRAAVRALGEDAMVAAAGLSDLSREQQLLWFQALGRGLVVAGQLLQHVPQFLSAGGGFVHVDDTFPALRQFSTYGAIAATVQVTLLSMHNMLEPGRAAAAAVEASSPAAAATPAELARLMQLAIGLQMQVAPITSACASSMQGAQGGGVGAAAMQELYSACQEGGLPQQLYSFGVACCAAFPQHGCCGNPACTNLDKFTETALASQGCSGCNKVRVLQVH